VIISASNLVRIDLFVGSTRSYIAEYSGYGNVAFFQQFQKEINVKIHQSSKYPYYKLDTMNPEVL